MCSWNNCLLFILCFLKHVCLPVCVFIVPVAALIVKWSPTGDSYAVAIGNKAVVYKLAVSTCIYTLNGFLILS